MPLPPDPRASGLSDFEADELRELLTESAKRRIESLKLYEPLAFQEEYHRCTAKECILQKGNQVGGEQPITEPALTPTGWVPLGELQLGDKVIGGDGKPCSVVGITEFGLSPTYRFTFSDGTSTESGITHNWTCRVGGRAGRPQTPHVDDENWNVVTTAHILKYTNKHGFRFSNGRYRVAMPSVQPVEFDGKPVPKVPRKAERYELRKGLYRGFKYVSNIEFVGHKRSRCIQVDNRSHTYVTRDYIVTHNSLCGFVEVSRAVTGQDPYNKYPERDGVAVCLGYGEKHIGRVIYQYMFKAGAFYIIRDAQTGEWRSYRPWPPDVVFHGRPGDRDRQHERKPAPPLIPGRFIVGGLDKGIAWEKRSEKVFSRVEFTTGWTLYALNSAGEPGQAQGFQADLYDIDEDVARDGWYDEALGRTVTRNGKIRWHALPHAKTDDIVNMIEAAELERDSEKPTTVCIRATIFDNPFVDEESRAATIKRWRSQGEDEYRKRVLGELTTDSVLMYPTFNKYVHDALRTDPPQLPVQKALVENAAEPPADWCRYMVVDPGHTVCAVSFLAVPPPELGNHVVCYDELYLRQCDAEKFGAAVQEKAKDRHWQEFIIDAHGGRLRELGSGITPQRQYEKQLQKRGLVCDATEYRFRNGSDDIKGREQMLREWFYVRQDGTPKLLISVERCPNLCRELGRFKKKTTPQGYILDEGNRKSPCHAVETLEYAAAHGMLYVKPKGNVKKDSWVRRVLREREMREMQRRARSGFAGKTYHNLGPQGVGS